MALLVAVALRAKSCEPGARLVAVANSVGAPDAVAERVGNCEPDTTLERELLLVALDVLGDAEAV